MTVVTINAGICSLDHVRNVEVLFRNHWKWIFLKLADMGTFPTIISKVKKIANMHLICKQCLRKHVTYCFINSGNHVFKFPRFSRKLHIIFAYHFTHKASAYSAVKYVMYSKSCARQKFTGIDYRHDDNTIVLPIWVTIKHDGVFVLEILKSH